MNRKSFIVAAFTLVLASCTALCACGAGQSGDNDAGLTGLEMQVKGVKDTYTNIYGRAERNGGLFGVSESVVSTVNKKSGSLIAYAEESDNDTAAEGEVAADETDKTEISDTSSIISQMVAVAGKQSSLGMPSVQEVKTYVLDVFAYTQIASHIATQKQREAITQIYSVDYAIDEDFQEKMQASENGWVWRPNIPEVMEIVGYDSLTSKVNIVFEARKPSYKESGIELFERVNSEMYYRSDDDFGYAQITTRYDINGDHTQTGFNYFSMKDRILFEANFSASGSFQNLQGMSSIGAAARLEMEELMSQLIEAFESRTETLTQLNLKQAEEEGVGGIVKEGEVYVKQENAEKYDVTFNYEILAKMMGNV